MNQPVVLFNPFLSLILSPEGAKNLGLNARPLHFAQGRLFALLRVTSPSMSLEFALAREYNKRWLARSAPAIFKVIPNANEEAICADEQCGGFCVLVRIDLKDSHNYFTHECQTCLRRYRVEDRVYMSGSKEGEVVQVSVTQLTS